MKRFILVLLAIGVAACAGSAGAYFTGQAEVSDNIIRAGGVSLSCEPTSAAICVDSIAPGTVSERSLTVVNTGALPASFVVTGAKKAGITDFYNALTCQVAADGAVVYDGPLNALRTAPFELAAGARARLTFGLGLPASAGNDLSGDYVKMSFYVDAEQVH
ncbi:MAG: hypothetical protein CVT59_07770 [Actinobacteria bacterium HGW-Actinobacteria-1]|jgi:hypothetical protein|nr:MAG: hypothetical protein CVT59_07770 [Actinobacteria bacterium HGW-Actinobacteria-1]